MNLDLISQQGYRNLNLNNVFELIFSDISPLTSSRQKIVCIYSKNTTLKRNPVFF